MNIFILDESPMIAASYHCDKHCVKMILETAQMLGSAVIRHGALPSQMPLTASGKPYRGGYHYHPCTVWCGDTRKNFLWLCELGISLCAEYTERYGKVHACEPKIMQLARLSNLIPMGELTDFAIAISDDSLCRSLPNFDSLSAVDKYREYYNHDKSRFANWRLNTAPNWYKPIDKTIKA